MICVFDCETVPDAEAIRGYFGLEGSDVEVSKRAFEVQKERSGSDFLPVPFHRIVAISAVVADEFGRFQRVSTIDGVDEKEILGSFLKFLDAKNPKLVSFNGRGFDLPMIMVRALKYGFSCPSYFEIENQKHNKNKWDNYRTRYSDRFHLDLMDSLADFGAVRGLNLDALCKMAGLPGKYDTSGDQVFELFYEGKIKEIKEYCESDVLNTYWLYLRYELLRGNITKQDYFSFLQTMGGKLGGEKSYAKVFKEAIEREIGGFLNAN